MDRNNIDKIAKTPEDRLLLAKVWDKIYAGLRKSIPAKMGFDALRVVQWCFLSALEDKEVTLLAFLRLGYRTGSHRRRQHIPCR